MPQILRANDHAKDQTYFIWQIKQEQLPHILFPVGVFQNKAKVREYADSKGLITSSKPDSQGLCFVGQTSLREMLLQTIGLKKGFIYAYLTDIQAETIGVKLTKKTLSVKAKSVGEKHKVKLGEHDGAFLYTIGQRQNLGISNGPWFVQDVNVETNEVIVCHQKFKEEMDYKSLLVENVNWHVDPLQIGEQVDDQIHFKAQCQIRYHGQSYKVLVKYSPDSNTAMVDFESYVNSPAKGQSVVFYDYDNDTNLLGGSMIKEIM
jgi:tRNA-uridine 2-sulfurtransferase